MVNGEIGSWVLVMPMVMTFMRELKYKNKTIKMDEKTWKSLKYKRKRSGLSWNLYLLKLIEK